MPTWYTTETPTVGELWSSDTMTVKPLSSFLVWTGKVHWSLSAAKAARLRDEPNSMPASMAGKGRKRMDDLDMNR